MSMKVKLGNWAAAPINNNTTPRPLTGRVIFGMLTGPEAPESNKTDVITSAKDRRR